MTQLEYTFDRQITLEREEAIRTGIEQGLEQGLRQGRSELIWHALQNCSPEEIAHMLGIDLSEVMEVQEQAKGKNNINMMLGSKR